MQYDTVFRHFHHGRLDADAARAAVDDQINGVSQLLADMGGSRRADPAERVGAGSRDREAGGAQERLRDGMLGDAQSDGGAAGRKRSAGT